MTPGRDQWDETQTELRIMKLARSLIALLASGLLAGCMVGPNYHRPAVQTPTVYRDLSENPQLQAQAASYADLPWWQVFKDPKLQELIRLALKQNYDLQLATERIVAARAELAITRSNLFPQVQGNGNFIGGQKTLPKTNTTFSPLLPMQRSSWISSAVCAAPLRPQAPSCWLRKPRGKRSY